ncbi:MAG: molybdopterin molybdotransferase MoeA [Oligoflexia bacterium]|nr:molybdopterin molybdotransferase MoeA [Oligoflexia bacterium]
MISVEQAVQRCLAAALPLTVETVAVPQAAGRLLTHDVLADCKLPPWDNSAMDGYAVIAADTRAPDQTENAHPQPGCDHDGPAATGGGAELVVVETIPAGGVGRHPVVSGCCARIMTGAPLPAGADAIVMREHVQVLPGDPERVRIAGSAQVGQHIRRAGEELGPGDRVLCAGTTLGPGHLGLLSSLGQATVDVARCPLVAVIATGDELVAPGQPLGPGQIHASNSAALCAWVEQAGGLALDCGLAPDTLAGTKAAFHRALDAGCDLLLSTGGVSVGDFDFVKEALAGVGAEMDFWKVRVKPGKPLAFGRIGGVPAFGLPGNPVSCQVGFLEFVRPVIRKSMGDPHPFLPVLDAVLEDGHHKRKGRAELVRVSLRFDPAGHLFARLTGGQGSGRSGSIARAHGLALLAADAQGVPAGGTVAVQVFDWSFAMRADSGYRWSGG